MTRRRGCQRSGIHSTSLGEPKTSRSTLPPFFSLAIRPKSCVYERADIPTDQVHGQVRQIDRETFLALEELYNTKLLPEIKRETGLENLRLVAVRANVLEAGGSVSLHRDGAAYVVTSFVVSGNFEGGEVFFEKDDGSMVEVPLSAGSIFVGKCTNQHGIREVLRGCRQSVVFFAMPEESD